MFIEILIIKIHMQRNDNQQLQSLSREQLQVFLSGRLGDGSITTTNSNSTYFYTSCKFEEYIDEKSKLLGNMFKHKGFVKENGYCKTPIHTLRSCSDNRLEAIKELPVEEVINNLDELGLALWVYDDGSLHKSKLFYNINTQAFPKEIQEQVFIPFFNKFGIYPKLQVENKKDGRQFWYLRIGKFDGAGELSKILEKYPFECFSYKRWSSETIQKWSKLQEELKSQGKSISDFSAYALSLKMKKIEL